MRLAVFSFVEWVYFVNPVHKLLPMRLLRSAGEMRIVHGKPMMAVSESVDRFACSFSVCSFQFRAWSKPIFVGLFETVEMIVLELFCCVSSVLFAILKIMFMVLVILTLKYRSLQDLIAAWIMLFVCSSLLSPWLFVEKSIDVLSAKITQLWFSSRCSNSIYSL